jgi:hypothetical protein
MNNANCNRKRSAQDLGGIESNWSLPKEKLNCYSHQNKHLAIKRGKRFWPFIQEGSWLYKSIWHLCAYRLVATNSILQAWNLLPHQASESFWLWKGSTSLLFPINSLKGSATSHSIPHLSSILNVRKRHHQWVQSLFSWIIINVVQIDPPGYNNPPIQPAVQIQQPTTPAAAQLQPGMGYQRSELQLFIHLLPFQPFCICYNKTIAKATQAM